MDQTLIEVRARNWAKLCSYYEWTPDDDGPPDRFAAASREYLGADDQIVGGAVSTWPTEAEAMHMLGDAMLDGYTPDAVYDLDTGERIEIHIATPTITRSEDQGVMDNPLEDEDEDED